MILEILNKNYDAILMQLIIIFLCWIIVICSIGIDLYFGIQKSKKEKVFIHSYGLRQTTFKSLQYLAFMCFMLFLDILNPLWVYFNLIALPLVSIFGAIVLVYTEWKSVHEKSSYKFRGSLQKNASEILKILQDHKEFLNEFKNLQNEKYNKQ